MFTASLPAIISPTERTAGFSHCERMRSLRRLFFTHNLPATLIVDLSLRKMSLAKRARKANWVGDETLLLLRELQKEGPTLFGKISVTNSTKTKAEIWKRIACSVSALGHAVRTAEDARMKWKGLKRDVFKKD